MVRIHSLICVLVVTVHLLVAPTSTLASRDLLAQGNRAGEGGRGTRSATRTAVSEALAKSPSVSAQLSKSITTAAAQYQKQATAKAASTGARHLLAQGNRAGEGGRGTRGATRTAVSEALAKGPSVSAQLPKSITTASAQYQKQATAASRAVLPEKSSGLELGAIGRMPKL